MVCCPDIFAAFEWKYPIQSFGLLEYPKEYVSQIDLDVKVHGKGKQSKFTSIYVHTTMAAAVTCQRVKWF